MSDLIAKKLKKYLLLISILFFISIWAHLIYLYLYDWAESEAIEWWTVSEALIWTFPHFNPLIPSDDHNSYINRLLYRSMLEYSTETWTLESDLVNCNLDNLLYIECILQNNLSWSDGSPITTDDIKATLNVIKQTKVNPIIASQLDNITIEASEDSISFSMTKKDINILYIFLQPILPAKLIESLDTENIDGKFSEIWAIYSGRFRLININQDETIGVTKLTLGKNESYFDNDMYLEFLILNLYQNEAHFLRNRNSFNIFNDKDGLIWWSLPRLSPYEYTLSQFTSTFFNSEKLGPEMRKKIISSLNRDEIVESIWWSRVISANNPFLSEESIDPTNSSFDIWKYLATKDYLSKTEILKKSTRILTPIEEEKIISQEAEIKKLNTKIQTQLDYVISPDIQKYNFISEDNILIKGIVDEGVDSVYINDYKLEGFSEWDENFFYRLSESYDSITPWENSYKIYFWKGKEKIFVEEFVYIYNTDLEALNEIKESFFTTETATIDTEGSGTWASAQSEINNNQEEAQTSINSADIAKIEALDDRFYYNSDLEAFSLDLVYSEADNEQTIAANLIAAQIQSLWLQVNLKSLSLWDITTGLRNESLSYDMLLLWINLWFLESDIFPYFHSSQVQNGYNISNFKKLSLDILLEELKSNNLSITKQNELKTKILDILAEENILYTLYTPRVQLLIDKNIKNFNLPSHLPDSNYRYFALLGSYLSEKKMINAEGKSLSWFTTYILKMLLK